MSTRMCRSGVWVVCCLFFPCSVSYECASANNDQAIIAL